MLAPWETSIGLESPTMPSTLVWTLKSAAELTSSGTGGMVRDDVGGGRLTWELLRVDLVSGITLHLTVTLVVVLDVLAVTGAKDGV